MRADTAEKIAVPVPVAAAVEVKAPAETPDWHELLVEAVQEPGRVADAYRLFHKYSITNCMLACAQLRRAGLPLAPINTFKGWLAAKRPVQKGQKATVALNMPVPVKRTGVNEITGADEKVTIFTRFLLKRNWFHISQTDGEEFVAEPFTLEWDGKVAMDILEIHEIPFVGVDGSHMGYARGRGIAVSPVDTLPWKTRCREMARVILGHTAAAETRDAKGAPEEAALRDIEAEVVAYLVCATLGFEGMAESRAYIQERLDGALAIPERVARRAFSAADKILNAGRC